MALRKLIRSASALKSTAGEAVSGIAKGHAPRAKQAQAEPPRACLTDFQAAMIAEAQLPSEKESLAFEAQLHRQFDQRRNPETEIFCFTPDQVEQVKAAMTP